MAMAQDLATRPDSMGTEVSEIGTAITDVDTLYDGQSPESTRPAESIYESVASYCIEIGEDSCSRHVLKSAHKLRHELRSGKLHRGEKIIVIHGLPVDYIDVLRDEEGIDAAFIEALAGRRRLGHLSSGRAQTFEYPELVRRLGPHQSQLGDGRKFTKGMMLVDALDDSPRYAISGTSDEALLCRASLWHGKRTSILFLDRPLWLDPSSSLSRRQFPVSVTRRVGTADNAWEMGFDVSGVEAASLEHQLWEHARTLRTGMHLTPTIQKIALGLWTELFDVFTPELQSTSGCSAVLGDFQRSVDRNLDTATSLPEQTHTTTLHLRGWQLLSDRVERRMRLAHLQNPPAPRTKVPDRKGTPSTDTSKALKNPEEEELSDSEIDQRGLDRVSYIGGIVLPFSLVSGILSMGDTFGPGGDMFYLYWAIAVPLTIITLLIIYADSVRREVVWIQVAAENVHQAHHRHSQDGATASSGKQSAELTPDLEQGVPVPAYTEAVPAAPQITPATAVADSGRPVVASGQMLKPRFSMKADHPRVWKQQRLGWAGAAKKIFQLYEMDKTQTSPHLWGRRGRT